VPHRGISEWIEPQNRRGKCSVSRTFTKSLRRAPIAESIGNAAPVFARKLVSKPLCSPGDLKSPAFSTAFSRPCSWASAGSRQSTVTLNGDLSCSFYPGGRSSHLSDLDLLPRGQASKETSRSTLSAGCSGLVLDRTGALAGRCSGWAGRRAQEASAGRERTLCFDPESGDP